jgi:UDP-N-acetylmuramyl pentapeptide phosphotransferase/UDP-N-acetylglucosamine-1-phosphate transferase
MHTLIFYIVLLLVLVIAELLYMRIAIYYGILDKPGPRRSHAKATLRGGGVIFLLPAILAGVTGRMEPWMLAGLLVCGIAGFWDDLFKMKALLRLFFQIAGIGILMYGLQTGRLPIGYILIAIFLATAWINAFNFMDGINGMLVMYTLVCLGTFWFVPELYSRRELILLMGTGALAFAFFNARIRATAFAGDVGSLSMAFFLGAMMGSTILASGKVQYLLLFSVYGIDTAATIFFRLLRRENILRPHRSHLYQYLANERALPHILVAGLYAGIQLLINVVFLPLIVQDRFSLSFFFLSLGVLSAVYLILRRIFRPATTAMGTGAP